MTSNDICPPSDDKGLDYQHMFENVNRSYQDNLVYIGFLEDEVAGVLVWKARALAAQQSLTLRDRVIRDLIDGREVPK